jgi:hypothetical protein
VAANATGKLACGICEQLYCIEVIESGKCEPVSQPARLRERLGKRVRLSLEFVGVVLGGRDKDVTSQTIHVEKWT